MISVMHYCKPVQFQEVGKLSVHCLFWDPGWFKKYATMEKSPVFVYPADLVCDFMLAEVCSSNASSTNGLLFSSGLCERQWSGRPGEGCSQLGMPAKKGWLSAFSWQGLGLRSQLPKPPPPQKFRGGSDRAAVFEAELHAKVTARLGDIRVPTRLGEASRQAFIQA